MYRSRKQRNNMLSLRSRSSINSPEEKSSTTHLDGNEQHDDYHKSEQKKNVLSLQEKLERLCCASHRQHMSLSQIVRLSFRFLFQCHRLVLVGIAIFAFLAIRRAIILKYQRLFGKNVLEGGKYGRVIDEMIMQRVIDTEYQKRKGELKRLGISVPSESHARVSEVLSINTQSALREIVGRRETRRSVLWELETRAEALDHHECQIPQSSPLPGLFNTSSRPNVPNKVPRVLFVPDLVSWIPARPNTINSYQRLTFDESEMRQLMQQPNVTNLLEAFDALPTLNQRVELWSIVAIYLYGGVFLGNHTTITLDAIQHEFHALTQTDDSTMDDPSTQCTQPLGMAILEQQFKDSDPNKLTIGMLAATPRHPHMRCLIHRISNSQGKNYPTDFASFVVSSATDSNHQSAASSTLDWMRLTTNCNFHRGDPLDCCQAAFEKPLKTSISDGAHLHQDEIYRGQLFLQVRRDKSHHARSLVPETVSIREVDETKPTSARSHKIPLEVLMQQNRAEPGWLCSRCLKASVFGSFDSCTLVCPSAYEDLMCHTKDVRKEGQIVVQVQVQTRAVPRDGGTARRIPRIIHQTWFETLSADRYPQLVRLQNSWKNSGWEYRLYTDDDARQYIRRHFPKRFVDAFDTLIPGAYKADLFRYLVLLKDGGIYSDVDIMLETNLDAFVTPDLAFFAPRDVVGDHADQPFCLWNGLIGSAPGHPFLVRAVERLVNLIMQRADMYDMESDVCRNVGHTMETWKVRAEPLLLLSGPCALGVAVNDVLDRPSLTRFDIGWLPIIDQEVDHGDALLLVGDKYDLGAFRISDPERNIIIAATDMQGLDKAPRERKFKSQRNDRSKQIRSKVRPHYSNTAIGKDVWGQQGVYADDLVEKEELIMKLQVHRYGDEKNSL